MSSEKLAFLSRNPEQCTFQNILWEAAVSLNLLFSAVVQVCVRLLHLHNWVFIANMGKDY